MNWRSGCVGAGLVGVLAIAGLSGCNSAVPMVEETGAVMEPAVAVEPVIAEIVTPIEEAHGKAAYDDLGAAGLVVRATFDVDFGGGDLIAGTMWFDTAVGKTRMELDDGTVVVFDGEACWVSADAPKIGPDYRFHALTWPYFAAAPFKLSDPGVSHMLVESAPLTAEVSSVASKMTFGEGVGDAPDDWYLVFPDADDGSLAALAYIVSYGKDLSAGADEPGASIVYYDDPTVVNGVAFATRWTFYLWDAEQGPAESPKGAATLSDFAFVGAPVGAFENFEGSVEAELPGVD